MADNKGSESARLTIKQEQYTQGLFSGLTQREAYKQAYDAGGMSDEAIDVEACRLAANPNISLRIDELTNELKLRNMVTVERVLAELSKVGYADIKDYLSYKTIKTQIDRDEETGEPIYGYKQIVDTKPSSDVDGTLISEVSIGKGGIFKFKLHDKMAAIDKMGKYLGMFTDKMEANINITQKLEDFIK